jgi:hypothetical protein
MDIIIGLFIVFVVGGWLVGKTIGELLFPKTDNFKPGKTEIHNHYYKTENHLHVTKDDLKSLSDKSKKD